MLVALGVLMASTVPFMLADSPTRLFIARGLRGLRPVQRSEHPPRILRCKTDKKPAVVAVVPEGADVLRVRPGRVVPGPGRKPS